MNPEQFLILVLYLVIAEKSARNRIFLFLNSITGSWPSGIDMFLIRASP
jgi:hypothetical protein